MNREARNALRRCERARKFPDNTCPASRAAFDIAVRATRMIPGRWLGIGADQGMSLVATVEALWKARTELDRLRKKLEGRP